MATRFYLPVTGAAGAQTITGTVKGIIRNADGNAAVNACAQCVIYVVSNDGATVRGQLIAFNNGALSNEFGTAIGLALWLIIGLTGAAIWHGGR